MGFPLGSPSHSPLFHSGRERTGMQFTNASTLSNIQNGMVVTKHNNAPVLYSGRTQMAYVANFRDLTIDSGVNNHQFSESGDSRIVRRTLKTMKKSLSEKMILPIQKKKTQAITKVRFLIVVNILGSAGPIKFVTNEDDSVSVVIDTALKMYAREGRLPVLGYDVGNFLLYPVNAGSDALKLSETIGSSGGRNFVLCKKLNKPQMTEARANMVTSKGSNGWRTWLSKSIASSH